MPTQPQSATFQKILLYDARGEKLPLSSIATSAQVCVVLYRNKRDILLLLATALVSIVLSAAASQLPLSLINYNLTLYAIWLAVFAVANSIFQRRYRKVRPGQWPNRDPSFVVCMPAFAGFGNAFTQNIEVFLYPVASVLLGGLLHWSVPGLNDYNAINVGVWGVGMYRLFSAKTVRFWLNQQELHLDDKVIRTRAILISKRYEGQTLLCVVTSMLIAGFTLTTLTGQDFRAGVVVLISAAIVFIIVTVSFVQDFRRAGWFEVSVATTASNAIKLILALAAAASIGGVAGGLIGLAYRYVRTGTLDLNAAASWAGIVGVVSMAGGLAYFVASVLFVRKREKTR